MVGQFYHTFKDEVLQARLQNGFCNFMQSKDLL